MALRPLPSNMFPQMLPRILAPSKSLSFTVRLPTQQSTILSTVLPSTGIALNIPDILSDIWDSVLRAVPKKKTSHMKKRHRQMAGKALKDVKNLNTCPACGQIKRSHVLCQHCVGEIKKQWGRKAQLA
ncbi:Putative WD domain protein [Aspergillus calidoustus]|uniref:Large ribosomal subunit protein bL32m n=1 Tax=Aspergillus calidoustus TaxID=454130 RepID=A0A0U5GG15_ASPCI|nr:Putative WD domain protein [Aspergillus calidoustus]